MMIAVVLVVFAGLVIFALCDFGEDIEDEDKRN